LNDLVGFFNVQSNYDWWKDYMYATKTRKGGFDRIVMNYVKVRATERTFCRDIDHLYVAPNSLCFVFTFTFFFLMEPGADYDL
jgi:hypothetical protein